MDSARGSQGHTPGCTAWQEDKDTSSPKLTPADRSSSMDDVHVRPHPPYSSLLPTAARACA